MNSSLLVAFILFHFSFFAFWADFEEGLAILVLDPVQKGLVAAAVARTDKLEPFAERIQCLIVRHGDALISCFFSSKSP